MRVVSLAPSATEIMFALGCGEQLVGRTAFCDFPPDATRTPVVGGWTTVNVGRVVALHPDLVLTSTFLQDGIADALRARGLRVCHTDPRTLRDVLVSLETVAAALGVPERGTALRAGVEAQLQSLPPTSYNLQPRVYAEEWPDPPMASGNWVPDLIQRVGGQSFLSPGERSRAVTLEDVRTFDPDVIVLNYCGMEKVPLAAQTARIQERPGWDLLRAVAENQIRVLPDALLNRPGPRLVEGAQHLAALLRASARAPSRLG